MLRSPFIYKTDKERVQACHEREKNQTWIHEHVKDIIDVHDLIKLGVTLEQKHRNLLNIVLNTTICDVFHQQAEEDYCLRMFGMEKLPDEKNE